MNSFLQKSMYCRHNNIVCYNYNMNFLQGSIYHRFYKQQKRVLEKQER